MLRSCLKLGMTLRDWNECTNRDVYNFIRAKSEKQKEDHEFQISQTKHIMWAAIAAMNGGKEANKVINLDGSKPEKIELTEYEKQEMVNMNKKLDAGMNLVPVSELDISMFQ